MRRGASRRASGQLFPYAVTWQAKRSSDAAYYSGAIRLYAQDAEDAKERTQNELAAHLGLSPESVEILQVWRL